ncbi:MULTISPECIES: hypothetical protein [unclassified Mesorhizobium]|uniref:hypothetical protein n=1 Tax=unclassified Mesorhizobium TaxID=325217 RepID=UPI002418050B|nr:MULTISPECIES: hypothetical protein [unclassified Mesorhizobium]MDG4903508.1 hypothetical protein [Mesorhizobium sp. WSM4962]MDG4921442.1 hypothetical protein [Mesorhizobium sp. WSM4989]
MTARDWKSLLDKKNLTIPRLCQRLPGQRHALLSRIAGKAVTEPNSCLNHYGYGDILSSLRRVRKRHSGAERHSDEVPTAYEREPLVVALACDIRRRRGLPRLSRGNRDDVVTFAQALGDQSITPDFVPQSLHFSFDVRKKARPFAATKTTL